MLLEAQATNGMLHPGHSRNGFSSAHAMPEAPRMRLKAVIDFICAVVLLLLAAPVLLLVVVLVKVTSPGTALYSQTRLGRKGRPYRILKIRTMYHNCERNSGPRWSTPGDPRVTVVGRFLRRTHLDELPQLWNVLKGEMSLVGPRPERPEFVKLLECAVPHYHDRLQARPGVTGLAQVMLPADTDLASVRKKLAYDLCYVRHQSFWLDLRIVICTAFNLIGVETSCLLRLPRPVAGSKLPESSLLDRRQGERRVLKLPVPIERRSGQDRRQLEAKQPPLVLPTAANGAHLPTVVAEAKAEGAITDNVAGLQPATSLD